MVYISYARLRSLQSPKKYHKEFIISHVKTTIVCLWIISGLLWLPAVNYIISLSFKNRECYFNFDPAYIIIQDTIAYLIPMIMILAITIYILRTLHYRNKSRKSFKKNKTIRLLITHNIIAANKSKMRNSLIVKPGHEHGEHSNYEFTSLSEYHGEEHKANRKESLLHEHEDAKNTSLHVKINDTETLENFSGERRNTIYVDRSSKKSNNTPKASFSAQGGSSKILTLLKILKLDRLRINMNAYVKLTIIIFTFCILWLPFCILWPVYSVCQTCISNFIYQLVYWMGYAQSLINPILLIILNPNYNKLKRYQ